MGLKVLKRHFSMKAIILSYIYIYIFFKLGSGVSCASFPFTVGYFAPCTVEISRYLIEVEVKLKKTLF